MLLAVERKRRDWNFEEVAVRPLEGVRPPAEGGNNQSTARRDLAIHHPALNKPLSWPGQHSLQHGQSSSRYESTGKPRVTDELLCIRRDPRTGLPLVWDHCFIYGGPSCWSCVVLGTHLWEHSSALCGSSFQIAQHQNQNLSWVTRRVLKDNWKDLTATQNTGVFITNTLLGVPSLASVVFKKETRQRNKTAFLGYLRAAVLQQKKKKSTCSKKITAQWNI